MLYGAVSAWTVTEVAEAWGFSHLGNFAKDYKKRFGSKAP